MIDLALVTGLYRAHAADLRAAIAAQRAFLAAVPSVVPQLDDVEAEITYLLLRHARPAHVVELGTFHGWSTTWILRALADNGAGHLHSFDRVDHVRGSVPAELAADRWTFHHGDVRERLADVPRDTGYLFVDAAHTASFARWFLAELFPLVPAGVPVSVHDVFHTRWALPLTEGGVVVGWLRRRGVPWFTAARRRDPGTHRALRELRRELGITGARGTAVDPMLWFTMPGR